MANRLAVLEASLAKKEAAFDARLGAHMTDVKSANGQPLNDKRGGGATLSRWDRQNHGLRTLNEGIERTKQAIERERDKIARVEALDIPEALRAMVEAGGLTQWRRHPNTFFVVGVEKGRIVWIPEQGTVGHRYASQVPKDQYPLFRDTFNELRATLATDRAGEGR